MTKAQRTKRIKQLEDELAELKAQSAVKPGKTKPGSGTKAKAKTPQVKKSVKSAEPAEPAEPVDSPNVVTAILGPYGTEIQARQEAEQFKHPQVFLYRSAIFPNPQNFQVTALVLESRAVRTTTNDKLYPFGVQLKIRVNGDPGRVRGWIDAFRNRARPVQMA